MEEPKGIGFYSIEEDITRYAKSEAQIQAYLNSSDLGINASRGQDKGWRIDPEWVKRIRAFRANPGKMELLSAKHSGQDPTTPQILYAIYEEDLRKSRQKKQENARPYEEKYLKSISTDSENKVSKK